MDWLKLYWRDNTPVTEASYSSKFVIDASNIVINDTSVLERATEAIKKIISSNPPPYRLLVSGGVDSQAMLYAWKKSGVDFEAHTFIYDQNMNLHDIAILWDFVKIHGINLIHHHISHFKFLEKDLQSYSKKYNCNSPHITFYMAMMDRFTDGTLILSGNPAISVPFLNFTILGLERYRLINKKNIVPFFWIHTPELAGSWFPYRNINDKFRRNILHMNEMKALYFSTVNIPVLSSHKKSGFEKYKLYYDNYEIDSKLRIKLLLNKSNLNPSRRPYDFLFRYTLIEANPISLGLEMIGIDYND